MTKAADILAVKSDGAYCHVSIANRRTLMIKQSISLWEESLPPCTFARVSRSLILNKRRIECVKALTRDEFEVHLQGAPDPILASRLEMSRVRAVLG
jgi:two-component system LytT family response regulator